MPHKYDWPTASSGWMNPWPGYLQLGESDLRPAGVFGTDNMLEMATVIALKPVLRATNSKALGPKVITAWCA
jgi:hypothetical protein